MAEICFLRVGATPLFVQGSQSAFGGAEVRALTFARALAKRGVAVEFAVGGHVDLPSVSEAGIRLLSLPDRRRGIKKLVGSLRGRLTSVPQSFPGIQLISAPVVGCFGVHSPTAQAVAAAKRVGKKTLLFLTSNEDAESPAGKTGKSKRHWIQHRYAIQQADEIVVQTETQRKSLRDNYGRTGTLIRNPIETKIDGDAMLQFRSHVLWVGRADTDSKRADLCRSLAARCPEIPFLMIVNGGDDRILEDWAQDPLPNVQIKKCVPFEQIDRYFQSASVLLNTSVSEGFPNAFLQAMKYRTPILSLDVDPDDVLTRHDCGAVAGTMDRMVQLLGDYWPRGPLAVQKGLRARDYLVQHHDVDARVEELQTLVERLAAGAAAA